MTTLNRSDLLVIHTSDRKTYKNCRQKWDFSSPMRQNLQPNREDNNLHFGTAIHAGLAVWYEPMTWAVDPLSRLHLAIGAFLDAYAFQGEQDGNGLPLSAEEHEAYNEACDLGVAMLTGYAKFSEENDKNFTPLHVEIKFQVETGVPGVIYQGRIDLLVVDSDGNYWIVDHKTTASLNGSLPDFLPMDEQIGSYCWAIQRQLNVKVEGFIYNELVKTAPHPPALLKNGSLSKDKRQNTTMELYSAAIREHGLNPEDYIDILLYLSEQPNKFFRRSIVYKSPRELQLIGERIALESKEMISDPAITPNPNSFTCGRCQFKAPCLAKMSGSDESWILNDLFHVRDKEL